MENKIYCFDIDDTILFSECDKNGEYKLLCHNTELVKKINELYNNGDTIILHTGRHWNHLRITIDQLQKVGVKYHTVVPGKPFADLYIDDKGITPQKFLELIK